MSGQEHADGRQAGEFTEEEAKVHQAGFRIIHTGLEQGLSFEDACAGLDVIEPEMRQVVIDDYLKVSIAEQHFQQGRPLEEVAEGLRCGTDRLEKAKVEMLHEVQKAAVDFYRKEAGKSDFSMEDVGGEPPAGKDH